MTEIAIPCATMIQSAVMETFGEFIRRRREAAGLNQTQFADLAGIGRSHLAQIESGKIGFPNAVYRRRIAKALGVSQIEMLLAAGELDESDLPGAIGTRAVGSEMVHSLADRVDWSVEGRRRTIEGIMKMYLEDDVRAGRTVDQEEDVTSDHEQYILPLGKGDYIGSL